VLRSRWPANRSRLRPSRLLYSPLYNLGLEHAVAEVLEMLSVQTPACAVPSGVTVEHLMSTAIMLQLVAPLHQLKLLYSPLSSPLYNLGLEHAVAEVLEMLSVQTPACAVPSGVTVEHLMSTAMILQLVALSPQPKLLSSRHPLPSSPQQMVATTEEIPG